MSPFYRHTLALILFLLAFSTKAQEFDFIVITNDSVESLPVMDDKEFYSKAAEILFQSGKAEINSNDQFFVTYQNEVLPYINSEHLQLRKIFIRGAASPEGSYKTNQRLGKARTQALLDEFLSNLHYQYEKAEVDMSSVTEDYGRLCMLMEEAGDKDYKTVKEIYDACGGNEECCKKNLRSAQGGRLWNRLLKEYFPQLRSANMVLWFTKPDHNHAPIRISRPACTVLCYESEQPTGTAILNNIEPQTTNDVELPVKRHVLAIRTNLLHDFLYMPQFGFAPSPNLQFEYYPKDGHYTYNIGFTWSNHRHWDSHEFFQVRDLQLEVRRYFKGEGKFMGTYIGAYAQGNKYGIGLSETKGWQGEGAGGGLSIGYVMPLNKKKNLRLEFMAAFGYYITLHDPYIWGNPLTGEIDDLYYYDYHGSASNFKERNHKFSWFGPTNIGIQLTYDILYRKK